MNEGLRAHDAAFALRMMDVFKEDYCWLGDELVTRFECERVLGVGEDNEHLP